MVDDDVGAGEESDDDDTPPQAAGRNERVRARLAVPGLEIDEICFWELVLKVDNKQAGVVLTEDTYNQILLHMNGFPLLDPKECSALNKKVAGNRVYEWAKVYYVRHEGGGKYALL